MSTDESVRESHADAARPEDDPASPRRRGRRRRSRGSDDLVPPTGASEATEPTEPEPTAAGDPDTGDGSDESDAPQFWHRDHPVFTPLTGFFTGVLAVVVVLGLLGAILSIVGYDVADHPWVFLVALGALLAINLGLVVLHSTRRFARYMLYGIITTPVIIAAVAALTLYVSLET